jgi:hypothetical protein
MRFNSRKNISTTSNTDFLRRYARRLLRDAHSNHLSKALPVIRRVQAARVLPIPRLTDLYHARESLHLKHMLRMIATELGYAAWADCKHDIDHQPPAILDRFRVDLGAFGDYNQVWFSSEETAEQWRKENGGHLVVYGWQAVVMTD